MGWNYLSIPKLQRLHRCSLGMDTQFHPTLYWACNSFSMLGLKLIHVSKRGHRKRLVSHCICTGTRSWALLPRDRRLCRCGATSDQHHVPQDRSLVQRIRHDDAMTWTLTTLLALCEGNIPLRAWCGYFWCQPDHAVQQRFQFPQCLRRHDAHDVTVIYNIYKQP